MSRTLPPPALPNAPGELRQDPLSGGWVAITAVESMTKRWVW